MARYDLEERTLQFTKNIYSLCREIPKSVPTTPIISQVIRSAGSVGANYIEANEALSKKDFVHRVKIARKEAKETVYWLNVLSSQYNNKKVECLTTEAVELKKILSAIIEKSK